MAESMPPAFMPPFPRRLWVVILLTCLLLTFPIAMVLLLTGEVYRRNDGEWRPIKTSSRYVYGGILALWLAGVVIRSAVMDPAWLATALNSITPVSPSSTAPASETDQSTLPACDSPVASELAQGALETDGTTKVEDFGGAEETFFDKEKNARHCKAQAFLSQGGEQTIAFQVFFGPSGKMLVQTEQGTAAQTQLMADSGAREYEKMAKAKQQEAAKANTSSTAAQSASGSCDTPQIAKDTPYSQARAALIAQGSVPSPATSPDQGSYCTDPDHAQVCQEMPEIEDCSADGKCMMNFGTRAGTPFQVVIFGNGPDDENASVELVKSGCRP